MSLIQRNYKLEYIDVGPPALDITTKVVSLDNLSLQSTGKIITANLTLNAEHGDFLTNNNGGATPLLKSFDRLRLTIIDDDGVEQHSKIMEITNDMRQLSRLTQYFFPLELEGRERNLKGVAFSGLFRDRPLNFFQMIEEIVQYYDSAVFKNFPVQPTLTTDMLGISQNEAPKINPQIWDFTNIDNVYDALDFVLEMMNLPVNAGGAGNRFAMIFVDDPLVDTNIILKIIIQGTNNAPAIPTLQQNQINPIMNIDKLKQPSSGTQVIVRGRPKTGQLYKEFDQFIGRLEFYRGIPFYDPTVVYPIDTNVRVGTQRFKAINIVPISTPPPNGGFWNPIDVGDFIGLIDYSPITKGGLIEFLNSFGRPEGGLGIVDFTQVGIPDSNLTIRDKDPVDLQQGTNREHVLFRTNTDDVTGDADLKHYLINETTLLEGTQVLVDTELGAPAGIFAADTYGTGAGNDANGRPYANSVVRFTRVLGINIFAIGDWIVIREAQNFDQVSVLFERKVYEYNVEFNQVDNRIYPGEDRLRGGVGITFKWQDASAQFLGNDCFHSPLNIANVDGLLADSIQDDEPLNDPNGDPYIQNSGMLIEFGYNALNLDGPFEKVWKQLLNILVAATAFGAVLIALGVALFLRLSGPDYSSLGWWWSIAFPYPLSTHNFPQPTTRSIGDIYGGDINNVQTHRYFDLFNINRTISGKRGYNETDSDSQSEITGFTLLMNFDITAGGIRIPFTGNLPFSHWAIDKNGVKWKSAKKFLRRLGETDRLTFEYGDMTPVYFSRTPVGINNVIENILVAEIEKQAFLFKENVLMEGIQLELGYDDDGRYSPINFETIIKPTFFQFFSGKNDDIRFSGTMDAINWIKTPMAISRFNTATSKRVINPDVKDFPNIVNIEQLQRYSDAQEQVETFQFEQYTVKQGQIADLQLEDSIYLKDSQLIDEQDDAGNPNTRLLAVREIHYSVPKNEGLVRKLVGVVKIT